MAQDVRRRVATEPVDYNQDMNVSITDAKKHLSRLIIKVVAGEEVIIVKAGKPVARLVRLKAAVGRRWLGSAKGDFTVPEDFNDPLPKEIEDSFWELRMVFRSPFMNTI